MAKFSDRLGFTQAPKELQIDSMNDDLRNSLWNCLWETLQANGDMDDFLFPVWRDYLKRPVDDFSGDTELDWFKTHFMESEWYEPYNIIEYISQNTTLISEYEDDFNDILEQELSGYRLFEGKFAPVTNREEVESIKQAMSEPASSGMDGVSIHIKKALHLLGKKPDPDYANSIKESISAVESVCKLITGEKSGGLEKALAKLDSQVSFHAGLKKGFLSLYGYTSDEGGIRHAILEQKDIGFAEAKFMLVTCSAFVNFVLEKARQAKLL